MRRYGDKRYLTHCRQVCLLISNDSKTLMVGNSGFLVVTRYVTGTRGDVSGTCSVDLSRDAMVFMPAF